MSSNKAKLTFSHVPGKFSVLQLGADANIPAWATAGRQEEGQFSAVTRTAHELSIVCPTAWVPPADTSVLKHEQGWCCLMIDMGVLPFGLTGILWSALGPLAAAGVGIFAMSTYNTDYILIKEADREAAVTALQNDGHVVSSA